MLRIPIVLAFSLLLSLPRLDAQNITLRQVGKEALFYASMAGYPMNGMLYNLDVNGIPFRTTLDSGIHTRIGSTAFKNARLFFPMLGRLYVIESDGSLDEIDANSGSWTTKATMGTWNRTERALTIRNNLYTIENGSLFHHRSVNYDAKDAIGGSEFYNIGTLILGSSSLFTMMREGTLYEINLTSGEWKKIGKSKAYKDMRAGYVLNDKYYGVDSKGGFNEILLSDGTQKQLDSTDKFIKTFFFFTERGKLYVVMKDGTLYEVQGI